MLFAALSYGKGGEGQNLDAYRLTDEDWTPEVIYEIDEDIEIIGSGEGEEPLDASAGVEESSRKKVKREGETMCFTQVQITCAPNDEGSPSENR